jgi:protein-S-isoprenylcysteine O-methyltransferase Ste14
MARIWFKKIWTSVIPKAAERSTFVILASLLLLLLYWQWRPMPQTVWHIESGFFSFLLQALFWIGWLIVLLSTFVINHFDLFGLRQIWLHFKKADYTPLRFKVSLFYKVVRHPLMMGFIIAFWATPHMSQGHLLFSIATTCYILVAIQLEERDLVVYHGTDYLQYRKAVPMLIPLSKSKAQ